MQNNNTNIHSDVDLVKDLLDPSLNFDLEEPDDAMKLFQDSKTQPANRQLNHSTSSDNHHLYYTSSSIDGLQELEQAKQFNAYLIMKIKFLANENKDLVEKSKEQLSTIRIEKSHEEQLNSLKSQLQNQDDTIGGLTEEARVWKDKYLDLYKKHQALIDEKSEEQIEFKKANKALKNRNDELEVDYEQCSEQKKALELENKSLKHSLFNATSELEHLKKNFDSCESLKKDRLKSQQKCHVISEKLESCKTKCEQSTNLLKEKICLVDQQAKEIKELNLNANYLKKMNSINQLEIEKNKIRIDELERKLKDKDDLVNEYKTLYYETKNTREIEIKHEHQTIKILIMINSKYESELAQLKGELEKLHYDRMISQKNVPDLIEDKKEHDRLERLKKKYNFFIDDAYEPFDLEFDTALDCDKVLKNGNSNGNNGNNNGTSDHDMLAKKKEELSKLKNGSLNGKQDLSETA